MATNNQGYTDNSYSFTSSENINRPSTNILATKRNSVTSLRSYKINNIKNDLPRVHRTSSVTSMNHHTNIHRNFSVSDLNSQISSLNPFDTQSIRSNTSSCQCTPNALDFETASNISLFSHLEIPGSNISSVSDLTGYEEEFIQIKKLVGPTENPPNFDNKKRIDVSIYTNQIDELKSALQGIKEENEQYKFDLKDLETKIELIWREKYQDLLRKNAQSEGQLDLVTKQFENALKEKEIILKSLKTENLNQSLQNDYISLQTKYSSLEKQFSDLNSKLSISHNESKQLQSEYIKTENENEKLRISVQELKSEVDSRNSVLFGLKNKITEQHIEIQNHLQAKLKLENQIKTLHNDLQGVRKSEKWYAEQLHDCQIAKNNIQQELMSTKTNLIGASNKIETLKMDLQFWKNQSQETQTKAMREKEKLLRKVEMIEADLIERETGQNYDENNEGNFGTAPKIKDNILIEDYEDELKNLKKLIEDQNATIQNHQKQNTEYIIRITTTQKNLNENQIQIQTLENRNRDLEMKCNSSNEAIRTKDTEILDLRNKIVNLEVGLHAANREKLEIDDVVKSLRKDFNKFMKCYQLMKEQLEEKSKIISQFEQEKQDLFMENNWKICEIEELQHRVLNVKSLQAEIVELKNELNQLMIENDDLIKENTDLKQLNQDLKLNTDLKLNPDSIKDLNNYENVVVKLNETLKIRESQLENQLKNCELLHNQIESKEFTINSLKDKLNNSQFLEIKNLDLSKKLTDANSVIEQFNNLCRNSEIEKNNLAVELNLLKSDKTVPLMNREIQTELYGNSLELIKTKLIEIDGNHLNLNNLEIFNVVGKYLDTIKVNNKQLERSNKNTQILRGKLLKIKRKFVKLHDRCIKLDKNFDFINRVIHLVPKTNNNKTLNKSVGLQTYPFETKDNKTPNMYENLFQDIKNLKILLRVNETERKEQYKRFETNNRTLLKKVKEHMRGRKRAETQLNELKDTYHFAVSEINNLKLTTKRQELELSTFKTRCDEYKSICENLNANILTLEKEKQSTAVEVTQCLNCLDKTNIEQNLQQLQLKFNANEAKLQNSTKEINNFEQNIVELKKLLFNEKLQSSALKKQVFSIQMCLTNANEQLDMKKVELNDLKTLENKLKLNIINLENQIEDLSKSNEEYKEKYEENCRGLEEKHAKDQILADEIKNLSCHLHQKSLDIENLKNKFTILESKTLTQEKNYEKIIEDLNKNLSELENELQSIRNDKFFLQRLCADLKMSLQGTVNQNKVLKHRLDVLETQEQQSNLSLLSKIDEDYINKLLKQSTVSPEKPLKNLRSCLDSLKEEMISLQNEIYAKTHSDISL